MLKSMVPALGNREDLLTGQYRLGKFYTNFQISRYPFPQARTIAIQS